MSIATGNSELIQRLIVVAVLLSVGVAIVGQVIGVGSLTSVDGSVRVGDDDAVALQATNDVNSVADSTGRAAELSGGSVDISGGLGVEADADGNWTFATYAAVDNASQSATLWTIGQNYVIGYSPTNGGELFVWHYNESSTNSYVASVATATPGSLSPVVVQRDGNTLTLFNESGASSTIALAPGSETTATLPATDNLDGRLDETRTWDRPLTATERSNYRNDGIQPVAVGNRSARILFDTKGDNVAIEFRGVSGQLVGAASRGTGLSGTVMTEGSDFELVSRGPDTFLRPLSGGELADQPRVFVQTPRGPFEQVIFVLGSALALSSVVLVVAVARRILEVRDL